MEEELRKIQKQAEEEIKDLDNLMLLEEIRHKYLGKKGNLTAALRGISDLSNEEKREIGSLANNVKEEIKQKIDEKQNELIAKENIVDEFFDISIPR